MIYTTISVQHVYRTIELVCNLDDDNELANIYEFIGLAIRDIGAFMTMERVTEKATVEDHRVPLPCDFFALNQVCYNGWPLTWTGQTFKYQYLLCDDCFNQNSTVFDTDNVVRQASRLSTVLADYTTDNGVQIVNVNQIVKVLPSHTAGGEIGHYYKRVNTELGSTDLSSVDYTGVNWEDVSTDTNELNTGAVLSSVGRPDDYSYHINPGYIITSFQEGTVEISYDRIPTDDDGFYKIPDDPEYLKAVIYYVKMMLAHRGFKFPEEPLAVLKNEWKYYRGMARSNAQWMNIDQMVAFTKRWTRPLAVLDRAQNFFKPEF